MTLNPKSAFQILTYLAIFHDDIAHPPHHSLFTILQPFNIFLIIQVSMPSSTALLTNTADSLPFPCRETLFFIKREINSELLPLLTFTIKLNSDPPSAQLYPPVKRTFQCNAEYRFQHRHFPSDSITVTTAHIYISFILLILSITPLHFCASCHHTQSLFHTTHGQTSWYWHTLQCFSSPFFWLHSPNFLDFIPSLQLLNFTFT